MSLNSLLTPEPDVVETQDLPDKPWRLPEPARIAVVAVLTIAAVGIFVFTYYYVHYSRLTDEKLRAGPFANTFNIFAAPRVLGAEDETTLSQIAAQLRHSGYSESAERTTRSFRITGNAIEIFPEQDSHFNRGNARIEFARGKIARIIALADNSERKEYQIEPQLVTNIAEGREKRRLVRFSDIPKTLKNAVASIEDKRFFQHAGLDPLRIAKAAYVDLKEGRKEQGASTLSMQLARGLWLEPEKRWKRKIAEILITLHLEEKLSKAQIFEYYSNQVYLGRRGTYNIHGFGEGARDYFGKDISQLTLAEAATLAGLIQRPSYYNPFRYPDRALERRNVVLGFMRQNGHISEDEYQAAVESPLRLSPAPSEAGDAPYFLDLANEELQARLPGREGITSSLNVYSTLDLELQHAATEAVRIGMQEVDKQLARRKAKNGEPPNQPQVALIALDAHSGEIRAVAGGRNYNESQLNHALAKRQPGSSFKPFVYAAALNTAVAGGRELITPATTVADAPTTFLYGGETYEPGNFHGAFYGQVTLRRALAKSMNIATVKVAELVGYNQVVDMARRAGLNKAIHATPAVALGAYEATPLEMAGAYTVFANQGVYVKPTFLSLVRTANGGVLYSSTPERHMALDQRVAYQMVDLLTEVMNSGTAAGVRSRGFRAFAAGKTGTSRDGWFAGFTSDLICVVWVGYDDNRDLELEGSKSALPVWAEFMKRAIQLRPYNHPQAFRAPAGVIRVTVCSDSGNLATPYCPNTQNEIFVKGTEPADSCELHTMIPVQAPDVVTPIPPSIPNYAVVNP